jgi:NADPH2:quinone reductase
MKAVVCHSFDSTNGVRIETAPDPMPATNEIAVRVTAANVTFVDRLIITGRYQLKPPLPFTPGAVGAGEVVAVGPAVHDISPGMRVVALKPPPGYGMWASHAVAPEYAVARIPDGVADTVAAAAIEAYGTARFALEDRGRIAAGERVLIHGATGAVGSAAVEVAVHLGAETIAVTIGPANWPPAHAQPALVLDLAQIDDLRGELRDRFPDGIDLVLDPVGGEMAELSVRSLRLGGRYLVVGFAGGEIPKIPTNLALLRNRSIVGVEWASWITAYPDQIRAGMDIVLERLRRGVHHLPEPTIAALDELPEVLRSPPPPTGLVRTLVIPT